jgi:DNA-binding transcriptional LysR family regulator
MLENMHANRSCYFLQPLRSFFWQTRLAKWGILSLSKTLRNLRIADLELFIAAAHLGSLSKAAALHHMSQSAASTAIQRVEAAFGRPLCTHEKRAFSLTKEGKQLLSRSEQWLRALHDIASDEGLTPIRLATTHAIARAVVPVILPHEHIEVQLMRPDIAYGALLRDEADVALVLDNALWEGVVATEVGSGFFQLYSRRKRVSVGPVLLPEDQIEVLTLQRRWQQKQGKALAVKARLPSWSLIADICSRSNEIGFLPDFLADVGMRPVSWQPEPSAYRVLALYRAPNRAFQGRLDAIVQLCKSAF